MTHYFRCTAAAIGAALILGALAIASLPTGREAYAARYHLRSRTERFFERATPSRVIAAPADSNAPAKQKPQPKPVAATESVAE